MKLLFLSETVFPFMEKYCEQGITLSVQCTVYSGQCTVQCTELKTLEWWISGLMLNPNFFLISRLNIACSPHEFNLQKSQQIGIKDITF